MLDSEASIRITETVAQAQSREARQARGRPSHWENSAATAFKNPWDSWRPQMPYEFIPVVRGYLYGWPVATKEIQAQLQLRSRKPTWGQDVDVTEINKSGKIKATFLGHACFLVEMPVSPSSLLSRGVRVLFDPVFSHRCSPVQFMGPARFSPPPCSIEDVPEIDAIVISHNHYDHLDTNTIRALFKRPRLPHVFAPLGNQAYFRSLEIPESHIHILDWWDGRQIEVDVPLKSKESATQKVTVDITCTPGQHFTGRMIWDNMKSLWASWVLESVGEPDAKVYFAGDTAYRTVKDGEDEDKVPTCPAFKEIGEHFGGFTLALIPIGAYLPRGFMSSIHCAPQDSVLLFKDVKAKNALGMHWGTWALTSEDILDPPKRLKEECAKAGMADDTFVTCDVGETTLW